MKKIKFKQFIIVLFSLIFILNLSACMTNGLGNNGLNKEKIREKEINTIKEHILVGEGSEINPFIISTFSDLQTVSTLVKDGITFANIYLKMDKDIDCYGKTWMPIGYEYDTYFQGIFDGNGFCIENIMFQKCDYPTYSDEAKKNMYYYLGVFGKTDNAIIKNLEILNICITPTSWFVGQDFTNVYVGGLVGYAKNTEISNCKILDSSIFLDMGFYQTIQSGGLVGYGYNNNIFQTSVEVTSELVAAGINCGGFIGTSSGDTITNCYSQGSIDIHTCDTFDNISGGFVASYYNSKIDFCYSSVNIKTSAHYYRGNQLSKYSGGFLGLVGSRYDYNNTTYNVLVNKCLAVGTVEARVGVYNKLYFGGFVGESKTQIPDTNYSLQGQVVNGNNLSKEITMQQILEFVNNNWDTNIWIVSTTDLPTLK